MEPFPIELARSIMNLELQKETILKKDIKARRLCYCRKQILLNFTYICQLIYIRFTAKLIKFIDDQNVDKVTVEDLWEWYNHEIYKKMYDDPNLSNKMILIFNLLQDSLDEQFFEAFELKFKGTVNSSDSAVFNAMVHQLYEDLNEWMENYLLNILTLKLDCMRISDQLLLDYNIEDNFNCKGDGLNDSGCIRCTSNECPALGIGHDAYYAEEEIHLYMCDEFEDGTFLNKYFDIIFKYHKNPKNIKIIFDFMLYDEDEKIMFTENQRRMVMNAVEKFKSVNIINHRNINFNICRAEIVPLLR